MIRFPIKIALLRYPPFFDALNWFPLSPAPFQMLTTTAATQQRAAAWHTTWEVELHRSVICQPQNQWQYEYRYIDISVCITYPYLSLYLSTCKYLSIYIIIYICPYLQIVSPYNLYICMDPGYIRKMDTSLALDRIPPASHSASKIQTQESGALWKWLDLSGLCIFFCSVLKGPSGEQPQTIRPEISWEQIKQQVWNCSCHPVEGESRMTVSHVLGRKSQSHTIL